MKKHVTVSLLFLCFVVTVPNLFGQTCAPAGLYHVSPPTNTFNFIANPNPDSDNCWSHSDLVTFVTGVTSCSSFTQVTNNAFEFEPSPGSGPLGFPSLVSLTQQIVIPSSDTRTNFQLRYFLDFDDPDNASANRFSATVFDQTTNTYLYQSGTYNGSMPDLFCAGRQSPTMTFPGTLAGHTLQIAFRGATKSSDTHIRVYGVGFDGWN